MGQHNDLPQYQISPTPADSTLQCIEKAQICEHKCTVSKGDRRCLWAAVSLLVVATVAIGVYLGVHHESITHPSNNNNGTLQQVQAHALVTKSSISSFKSASEPSLAPTTMLSVALAQGHAPSSTITLPWLSTALATALPIDDHMYKQLAMTAASTQGMVFSSMTIPPSLTTIGHDMPTFTVKQQVGWMPLDIPPHLMVNEIVKLTVSSMPSNSVNAAMSSTRLFNSAKSSMSTQPVAAVAAAAESSPILYKPMSSDHYIIHGSCVQANLALLCMTRGFECVEQGNGKGPQCLEYKGKSDLAKARGNHKGHGALIGGIVGGVLGGLLLLALLWFLWRRKCHKDQARAAGNGPLVQPVDTEQVAHRPAH